MVHQPVSRGFAVFADGLACGDQRRLTGNGSALEVAKIVLTHCADLRYFTLLYFPLGRDLPTAPYD